MLDVGTDSIFFVPFTSPDVPCGNFTDFWLLHTFDLPNSEPLSLTSFSLPRSPDSHIQLPTAFVDALLYLENSAFLKSSLTLTIFHFSEAYGERFKKDILFRTEWSIVSHSLFIVQLWVSVLLAIYCKENHLCWGLTEEWCTDIATSHWKLFYHNIHITGRSRPRVHDLFSLRIVTSLYKLFKTNIKAIIYKLAHFMWVNATRCVRKYNKDTCPSHRLC